MENKTRTGTYPLDKSMYMQTQGVFDTEGERIYPGRLMGDRFQMVKDLRDSFGLVLNAAEDPWVNSPNLSCVCTKLAFSAFDKSRYVRR